MAGSTTVFFVFSVTACLFSSTAQAGQCVSCFYQNAGDGKTNLECVTEPFKEPHTQNISCDFATKACVSIAVYDPDYAQLRSFGRFCLGKVGLPSEGCNTDQNPSCNRVCSTDLCNQKNITLLYQEWTNGVTSLAPPAGNITTQGRANLTTTNSPGEDGRTTTNAAATTTTTPTATGTTTTPTTTGTTTTPTTTRGNNEATTTTYGRCVSCTYQNAGDGTTNLKCATEPFKELHTQNISCDFATMACVSKAVYDPDYAQLRSFGRFCLGKVGLASEGCNTDQNPSCFRVCSTDLCNQKNITLLYQEWTNGVPSLTHSLLLTLWLCAVSYLVV